MTFSSSDRFFAIPSSASASFAFFCAPLPVRKNSLFIGPRHCIVFLRIHPFLPLPLLVQRNLSSASAILVCRFLQMWTDLFLRFRWLVTFRLKQI
jgi:hypothetical protein